MIITMISNKMPLIIFTLNQIRIFFNIFTNNKKSSLHTFILQNIKNFRSSLPSRTIIKSQISNFSIIFHQIIKSILQILINRRIRI